MIYIIIKILKGVSGVLGSRHCPVKQGQNIPPRALEQDSSVWEIETCSNIFGGRPDVNSVSPLMPCYSTIDPRPYRDMCLKDMREVVNIFESDYLENSRIRMLIIIKI